MDIMPREMQEWIGQYVEVKRRERVDRDAVRKQGGTTPSTANLLRIPPLPLLPASYTLAPPTSKTSARSFWQENIGRCPRSNDGSGPDIEAWKTKVNSRLAALRTQLPHDLIRAVDQNPDSAFEALDA